MIDVERDGRIGVDLKFGSITFKQEGEAKLAEALVDVLVGLDGAEADTRVQMRIKVAADPETETMLAITEKCRAHIAGTLDRTARIFEARTARSLLFDTPAHDA